MRKILVQFDGSNFYNKVKKTLPKIHLTNFDYFGLAQALIEMSKPKIIYYIGEVRQYDVNRKSEILYANQQKLFTKFVPSPNPKS